MDLGGFMRIYADLCGFMRIFADLCGCKMNKRVGTSPHEITRVSEKPLSWKSKCIIN